MNKILGLSGWICIILLLGACDHPPLKTQRAILHPLSQLNNITYDQTMFSNDWEEKPDYIQYQFDWILDKSVYEKEAEVLTEISKWIPLIANNGKISAYYSQHIYGLQDSVWVLEYTVPKKKSCEAHPYKQQFMFSSTGYLIHHDRAEEFMFIHIKDSLPPILGILKTTCSSEGEEGQHFFYRFSNDQLICISDPILDSAPQTMDSKKDEAIFYPNPLRLEVEDRNQDGWGDLVFSGQQRILVDDKGKRYKSWRPFRTIPVEYICYYDPIKGMLVGNNQ
ncbi:MAG: hypothetical protein MK212_21495 [Saprospiraceae bacterium]|nr:hypothetical protein [Saprospiraceae bacterium]